MSPLAIFFIVLVVVLVAIGIYFIFKGDEEPSLGPTPGPTPGPTQGPTQGPTPESDIVVGRYVKLEHTIAYDADIQGNDQDRHANINFTELEVYDIDGNNLALNKTVTGSDFRGGAPNWKLVDGDFTNFSQTLSLDETEKDYMLVDLGAPQEINKIKITNRSEGDKKIIGVKVQIIDKDQITVQRELPVITTAWATHTITFPENEWS